MDWLVLILLVPFAVVTAVLWFGFSGCDGVFGLNPLPPIPLPPVAPGNLVALLKVGADRRSLDVELSWENNEMRAGVSFRIDRFQDGAPDFEEIDQATSASYQDRNVPQDAFLFYRVRAAFGNSAGLPSPVRQINTNFVTAFDSRNILVTPAPNATAYCLVQRLSASFFQASLMNARGKIVRITLKGPSNGPLAVGRVYISQQAVPNDPRNPTNPSPQPSDSLPATDPNGVAIEGGLARVIDRDAGDAVVTLLPPTTSDPDSNRATLALTTFTLDPTKDLLVAMDTGGPGSPANYLYGTLTGGTEYVFNGSEAPNANRPAVPAITNNNILLLIEKIEAITEQIP